VNQRAFLLCVSFLALLSACAEPETSYFPLTEGYDWRYQMTLETMGGEAQQKYIVRTLQAQAIEGKETFVKQSLTGLQILFEKNDTGTKRIGYRVPQGATYKNIEDEYLILPAKIVVDTEWESVIATQTLSLSKPSNKSNRLNAKIPVKNKIESLTDVVKVRAGEFSNCLRLHTKGFAFSKLDNYIGRTLVEIEQTNWYAPGVGLVKSVLIETTTSDALNRGELIMELESFSSL
jgi:hypothetical protein